MPIYEPEACHRQKHGTWVLRGGGFACPLLHLGLPVSRPQPSCPTALSGPQLLLGPPTSPEMGARVLPCLISRDLKAQKGIQAASGLLMEFGEKLKHTEMGLDQAPNQRIVISLPWPLGCFKMI